MTVETIRASLQALNAPVVRVLCDAREEGIELAEAIATHRDLRTDDSFSVKLYDEGCNHWATLSSDGDVGLVYPRTIEEVLTYAMASDIGKTRCVEAHEARALAARVLEALRNDLRAPCTSLYHVFFEGAWHRVLKDGYPSRFGDGVYGIKSSVWEAGTTEITGHAFPAFSFCY